MKRPLIILMASAVPVAAALVPMAANAAARDSTPVAATSCVAVPPLHP
ncbi:hypothetical protein AB0C02_30865 [Micromonospora sp. NPDC048999]